jgi:TetR/AcrR family fatty acid metabolism transcriptional regulator
MNEDSFIAMRARGRAEDKRRRILDAAVHVFAQKGYFGARVSEIASRASVADGTIYLYFRNKEDILVSLFDDVMAEHVQKGRQEVAATAGIAARLLVIARHHLRLLGGNRDLAVVFQVELRQSTKFMKRFTASWLQDYLSLISGVIEEGQRDGILRPDLDKKLATKAFFGAMDEMVTSWVLSPKEYDLVRQAAPVVDLFMHGAAASDHAAPGAEPALAALARGRTGAHR